MNANNTLPVILLMGPTASGKTDMAVNLASYFPIEIISVDSALVYREMNIGTAKPSETLRAQVPHHLIDIRDPAESYSAAQFCEDAYRLIPEIQQRGHIPLLVGGTMMYYRALINGLSELPAADPLVRTQLNAEAERVGWTDLHARLMQIDPVTAERVHPHDTQRIQRALEIYMTTGKTLSQSFSEGNKIFPYDFHAYALAPFDRSLLHERIRQRFIQMLHQGFIEEVRYLMARGDLHLNMPSMRAVGYRQVWEGLCENSSLEDIAEKGIAATRQLAKRQLTWLRSWPDITWFDSASESAFTGLRIAIGDKT
jgi:tRNA dimethylallyltransferase